MRLSKPAFGCRTFPRVRRLMLLGALAGALLFDASCAGITKSLGHGVGQGIGDGLAESFALDPAALEAQIKAGLDDPEVQRAISALAAAASSGAVEGVQREVTRDQLRGLATDVAKAFGDQFALSMKEVQLIPDLSPMLSGSVDRMLDVALSERRQGQVEDAVVRVLESSIHTIAEGLHGELGPAIGEVLDVEVQPRVLGMMNDPKFQLGLEENARAISRGIVFGSNDALAALDNAAEARGHKSILDQITDFEATDLGVSLFLAIAQTAVLFAVAAALTRGSRRLDEIAGRVSAHESELIDLLRARTAQARGLDHEPPTLAGDDDHPEDEPRV